MNIFETAYIINLKERKNRLENCKIVFKEWFDKITIFEAVKHNVGAVGCMQSHIQVIKLAKKRKLEYVLILEDDCVLQDFDYEMILRCLKDVKNNFHLLYLGGTLHEPLEKYERTDLFVAKNILTTHAYFIHSLIFERILRDYELGIIETIDVYYRDVIQPLGKSYITRKLMINQSGGYSDIQNWDVSDKMPEYLHSQFKKFTK